MSMDDNTVTFRLDDGSVVEITRAQWDEWCRDGTIVTAERKALERLRGLERAE